LEVSGDKDSDIVNINSDPEAGKVVEALEGGWDGDD